MLAWNEEDDYGVLEMGASGRGEIDSLCGLSAPSIGVITCIGEAHLGGFGSRQAIAESKAELLSALPRDELRQILSQARVFCCPSVYEPFGIVNLEAMACGVPVVASAVGGIPEIVVPGQTGELVPFESDGTPRNEPKDPERFARDLAEKLNSLVDDAAKARAFGQAGRTRVLERFSWSKIADQTVALYAELLA